MTTDESSTDPDDAPGGDDDGRRGGRVRDRIEAEADRAVEQFDQGIVDLLSWLLDTDTRARIYIYLRKYPTSTSEEIARGTGLYPSTVRESLAELYEEGVVDRQKRESEGAGNNPYEYRAMAPSSLVRDVAAQLQDELNTVFNLDRHLSRDRDTEVDEGDEPIRIEVDDSDPVEPEAIDIADEGPAAEEADEDDGAEEAADPSVTRIPIEDESDDTHE